MYEHTPTLNKTQTDLNVQTKTCAIIVHAPYTCIVTIDPTKDIKKYIANNEAVQSNLELLTNSPKGQTTENARG